MSALELPDHVQQAQQQDQRQLALVNALQAAMNQPHTTERVDISALAISDDNAPTNGLVLMVASPDGRRRDIALTADALTALMRQLDKEKAPAGADA